MFDGLDDNHAPLQRDGQRSEFEVGAERTAMFIDAGKHLGQPAELDGLAIAESVERALPPGAAASGLAQRSVDGVHG
ncbi:hypothetical protein SCALM49S_05209 [Streptomyces californicus]